MVPLVLSLRTQGHNAIQTAAARMDCLCVGATVLPLAAAVAYPARYPRVSSVAVRHFAYRHEKTKSGAPAVPRLTNAWHSES